MANTTTKRTPRVPKAAAEPKSTVEEQSVTGSENISGTEIEEHEGESIQMSELNTDIKSEKEQGEPQAPIEKPKVSEEVSYKEIEDLGNGAFALKVHGKYVLKGVSKEKAESYLGRY